LCVLVKLRVIVFTIFSLNHNFALTPTFARDKSSHSRLRYLYIFTKRIMKNHTCKIKYCTWIWRYFLLYWCWLKLILDTLHMTSCNSANKTNNFFIDTLSKSITTWWSVIDTMVSMCLRKKRASLFLTYYLLLNSHIYSYTFQLLLIIKYLIFEIKNFILHKSNESLKILN